MENTVLVDASDDLHRASKEATGDVKDRLDAQARHLAERAEAPRPEREQLMRQQEALEELGKERSLSKSARTHVEAAREKIASFLAE